MIMTVISNTDVAEEILTEYTDGDETLRYLRYFTVWEQRLQDVQGSYQTESCYAHWADQQEVDPEAHKCWVVSKCPLDVHVLSTGLRHRSTEFSIAQGTKCVVHSTDRPHDHGHAHRFGMHEDAHRGHKDSRANDNSHNDGYTLEQGDVLFECYMLRHCAG